MTAELWGVCMLRQFEHGHSACENFRFLGRLQFESPYSYRPKPCQRTAVSGGIMMQRAHKLVMGLALQGSRANVLLGKPRTQIQQT